MCLFTVSGGLIGADIAMWPAGDTTFLTLPVVLGLFCGFVSGVLVVWYIHDAENGD